MYNDTSSGVIPGSFKNIFDVPDDSGEPRWIYRKYTRHCEGCRITHPAGLRRACDHDTWVYEIPAGCVMDVTTDFADPIEVWTEREEAQQDQADQADRERESAELDREFAIKAELLARARKRVAAKIGTERMRLRGVL